MLHVAALLSQPTGMAMTGLDSKVCRALVMTNRFVPENHHWYPRLSSFAFCPFSRVERYYRPARPTPALASAGTPSKPYFFCGPGRKGTPQFINVSITAYYSMEIVADTDHGPPRVSN